MSHPLRLTHFATFPLFSLHQKLLLSFPWLSEYHPWCSCFLPFTHLTIHSQSGFPSGSAGKESTCNVRDLGSIPGFGKSPGERKGYPLQYSGLENWTIQSMGLQRVRHNWETFAFTFSRSVTACTCFLWCKIVMSIPDVKAFPLNLKL